ncbi:hypothetical protein V6L77_01085 [Pannonibacter sp. Pt2-lr]
MNLAVNVEMAPLALSDGTTIRRTHIGLIDGPGNAPQHLLAGVMALHGMLTQDSPGKPHYPPHRPGHVLVHCRAAAAARPPSSRCICTSPCQSGSRISTAPSTTCARCAASGQPAATGHARPRPRRLAHLSTGLRIFAPAKF